MIHLTYNSKKPARISSLQLHKLKDAGLVKRTQQVTKGRHGVCGSTRTNAFIVMIDEKDLELAKSLIF